MAYKSSGPYILWFSEIGKDDLKLAGGKGANLGEMYRAGFPVPPGFVLSAVAYFDFLHQTKLTGAIRRLLENLNVEDSKKLEEISNQIQQRINQAEIPTIIAEAVKTAYRKLGNNRQLRVAIRSSATAEDLPEASFAGQQESFMNIQGEERVVSIVKKVWASLFEPRSIYYREVNGFNHFKVGIAVPVQLIVDSTVSGIMFTLDPLRNDSSKIAIEAIYGMGDAVVSGSLTPDQYLLEKESLQILEKVIVKQARMLAYSKIRPAKGLPHHQGGILGKLKPFRPDDEIYWLPVSQEYQDKQKLPDSFITQLAILGKKIEQHYNFPQDIEWALADKKLWIVQTRPVTTIGSKISESGEIGKVNENRQNEVRPLLVGIAASPGLASGPVQIIYSAQEIDQIKKGDILVTTMTTPDFVPAMRRAAGIVTDSGGKTSHAAIVSREMGIPCVVGTELATKTLKNGELVTMDGAAGKIYQGDLKDQIKYQISKIKNIESLPTSQFPRTATKIYVNLGEPDLVEDVARRPVDGVGLLRAEFMIAQIGEHPKYTIEKGYSGKFVEKLSAGLLKFAKAFDPRPVVYRATDFRTNEYRSLKGGDKYEGTEENPMLGFRGVQRYLVEPDVFKLELEAIKRVRRYHQNLWLMLPFVRTPEELIEVKKIIAGINLHRSSSFKLWIMVEVPSTVIMLEKFIGVGIDGVSIGSNDLTQLILGLDRDNSKVAKLFDEQNPAVLWALEKTIRVCCRHGITSSICGQAPSEYPELVQKLIEWGITSISVNPDVIEKVREIVSLTEYNLVRRRF